MPLQDRVLIFSRENGRSCAEFAADVALLQQKISDYGSICNLLSDRYSFVVGLAAALLNGQTTILPVSTAPQAVDAAIGGSSGTLILGDAAMEITGPRLSRLPRSDAPEDPAQLFAALPRAPGIVHVFTSGSTGSPNRHIKTWETLAGGAEITLKIIEAVGLASTDFGFVGTTAPQHMFGLEATVFAGLMGRHSQYGEQVFFQADLEEAVRAAREAGIEAIVLVTSPAHLRFLETAVMELGEVRAIISATAPLSKTLAARLEERGDLPVFEVYGSTESGSLAIRRTIEGDLWTPLAGFTLEQHDGSVIAQAPHLAEPVPMGDAMSLEPDGRFRLLGRLGDMVLVAGKRTSLGALNAILVDTPGIVDGVVLREPGKADDQLTIVAVIHPSSTMTPDDCRAAIRDHLRQHFDPVFLPRKITFCDALPRSPSGKITAEDLGRLQALADD